jgi:hypothetical protein
MLTFAGFYGSTPENAPTKTESLTIFFANGARNDIDLKSWGPRTLKAIYSHVVKQSRTFYTKISIRKSHTSEHTCMVGNDQEMRSVTTAEEAVPR